MATPKKEKSGKWSIRVFTGYEYKDGQKKRKYKYMTADTKKEVMLLASNYLQENHDDETNLDLHEAMRRYIDMKENVLSASTIRGYEQVLRCYYSDGIGLMKIDDIRSVDLQLFVSNISKTVGAKSVKNIYALCTATLGMFRPDFSPRVTLPARPKADVHVPSVDDVKKVLEFYKGTPMEVAILLAVFVPTRRSEVCALHSDDLDGNVLMIRRAMVKTKTGEYVIKETPKTDQSNRNVLLPDFVVERLPKHGKLCDLSPTTITNNLNRTLKRLGIEHFSYHSLRHLSASLMKSLGFNSKVIQARGGWESDNIVNSVYMTALDDDMIQATKTLNDTFSHLVSS